MFDILNISANNQLADENASQKGAEVSHIYSHDCKHPGAVMLANIQVRL
jgi:hypothetical protein